MPSASSSHGHDRHLELSHQHQDSLQIKQDDKFFSRVMSKETSMANSSSRVYYRGASGSVPFMWESRPGTPKHTFNDTTLPPLTPPPSYLSGSGLKTKNNNLAKNMNRSIFFNVFPRLAVKKKRKNHISPSSSGSSTSSSSSSSSSSSTLSRSSTSCYSFSSGSRLHNNVHYDDHDDEDDHHDHDHDHGYSSSTACYGVKANSFNGSSRGRYSMVKMKNALLSIVGHGSSGHQGTA